MLKAQQIGGVPGGNWRKGLELDLSRRASCLIDHPAPICVSGISVHLHPLLQVVARPTLPITHVLVTEPSGKPCLDQKKGQLPLDNRLHIQC